MFLGVEAIDEETLQGFRKRTSINTNFEALEFARSLDVVVAINIIADPGWDHERFDTIRRWCMEIPEVVNISVATPYPGTEIWHTEQRRLTSRDYRLFDIQHAVLPTKLPLPEFYAELVQTQKVLQRKHLSWHSLKDVAEITGKLLWRGQTNFVRSMLKFNSVFNPQLQLADHARGVDYEIPLPPESTAKVNPKTLYIHAPARKHRVLDEATETFVDATRLGAG